MDTVNFTMRVPKGMTPYLANDELGNDFERNAMLLYGLIQTGILSHGRAAEILGVKKRDLIEFYNSKGLSYLNQSKDELLAEIAAYDRVKAKK
ncbi:MAG: UPF0175 family protein [Clostridia bacterium]|nr:UPF0175 family protein [Clostridia bacterium]